MLLLGCWHISLRNNEISGPFLISAKNIWQDPGRTILYFKLTVSVALHAKFTSLGDRIAMKCVCSHWELHHKAGLIYIYIKYRKNIMNTVKTNDTLGTKQRTFVTKVEIIHSTL
jgi:hypothetical protein